MNYYSFNQYCRDTFGDKVYKIAIDGGFTCPNRDGKIGTGGCIFCSGAGSGDFAQNRNLSITDQIESGKTLIERKIHSGKYIAYFQAFTNTYAPVDILRKKYMEALEHPQVVALSIATRPDCLPGEVLDLIEELNKKKPVWVELGLQTIHEKTASYIRRGYPLRVYEEAVRQLKERKLSVITHVILGLPGESEEDIIRTARYVGQIGSDGIKLQLLHVLKETDLEKEYEAGKIRMMTMEEYIAVVKKCIAVLPKNCVIHRMTGDGSRKLLVAPLWSLDKKRVLNALNKKLNDG